MIQDIGSHRFDNAYRVVAPAPGDAALVMRGSEVACVAAGELPGAPELRYAFSVDDAPWFLARYAAGKEPAGLEYHDVSWLRSEAAPEETLAMAVGLTLSRWYDDNRFCGRCGHALEHAATSRELVCPACGRVAYPKICPGVIVGVVDPAAEKIVLTKYARGGYQRFALVAGFTEVGESLEGTVVREVREEVGLHVKNLRYYGSQPWPFSDTLLVGYFCEVDGERGITLETDEFKEAVWAAPHEVPGREGDRVSITGEMMKLFRRRGAAVLDQGVFWEGER